MSTLDISEIRKQKPQLSSITDKLFAATADLHGAAEGALLVPWTMGSGGTLLPKTFGLEKPTTLILEMHAEGIAEWLAILQMLQGLLTVFASQCGKNQPPEAAAEWIRERPPFGLRQLRLRREIGRQYPGSRRKVRRLTLSLESECDRVTGELVATCLQESVRAV